VEHPLPVGIVQGQADLLDNLDRFRQDDPLFGCSQVLEHLAQVVAGDEFHHNVEMGARLAKVVDLNDTGVTHPGGGACLLQEAFLEIGPPGELGMHDLDGHVTLQGDVAGLEHRPHAAFAQEAD
jgi:hypothetical protein